MQEETAELQHKKRDGHAVRLTSITQLFLVDLAAVLKVNRPSFASRIIDGLENLGYN